VRFRSPVQSGVQRSMLARGFAGAAICASAFAVVALLVPVMSRWLDGAKPADTPRASASIPDDTGPALGPFVTETDKKRTHAKPKPKQRHAVLVSGNVVILSGTDALPAPAAATPDPAPAPATRPVTKPKTSKKAPKVVTDESNPVASPISAPATGTAAADPGLVRLRVQSVGIAPSASGDPELQAKLAIENAQPSLALPPTVTLHLRPQIPTALQTNNDGFAVNASVDMVDAPRTTAADPALRMRVRIAIAPAQASAPTAVPGAEAQAPPGGKSNVIALTAPLKAFVRAPEEGTPGEGDPTTPPGNEGPGQPTTPPDQPAPSDPTTPPYEGPGDPTTPPDQPEPGEPTTPPTDQPAPGDPTIPPTDPGPADPTTPPDQPAPSDPTTPGQPTAGDPTAIPPTEILIPVGPVRPNEGTATVPVPPGPAGEAPATDQVPIVVIVEELPPEEPPADPADPSTPVVQDPAPEVATPPADGTDPGTTPVPDGNGPATAIVVSTDAPPAAPSNS
jgi:hypothetical protein